MTPKQLRYFIEIARHLSFTKAAAILHVTQPALSRQMQELEKALGVRLFTRSDMGASLTAAGRLLAERAPLLLESYRQVSLEVSALADVPTGQLRFGIVPSLGDLMTTPGATEFATRHPNVQLSILESSSTELLERLSMGRLDFAILASVETTAGFGCVPLLREQMFYARRPGGEDLPAAPEAAFLASVPLISSIKPNSLRRLLEDYVTDAQLEANILLETTSVRLLTRIAAEGFAGCVLPYSALAESVAANKLEARPVQGLHVEWVLVFARSVEPTPGIRALIDIFLRHARETSNNKAWQGVTVLCNAIP